MRERAEALGAAIRAEDGVHNVVVQIKAHVVAKEAPVR